jgi:hypothetical protein
MAIEHVTVRPEHITNTPDTRDRVIYGVVGEFERPEALVRAGAHMHHKRGFTKLDAHSPFPIHGIDDAIGVPPSKLGYIVFLCGIFGFASAVLMIWYTSAVDYPLVIGGKPLFAWEFSVPVLFELTVLLASFGAVVGMLFLNGLPRFYHPVLNFSRFAGATDDRFLLVVEAADPRFDVKEVQQLLTELGASRVEVIEA